MTNRASPATASAPKPNGTGGRSRWWTPAASACCAARKSDDVIVKAAIEQVELAIEAANVIILVVNVQEGIVPLDREVAAHLRRSGKPVLVAVNKVDTEPRRSRRIGDLRSLASKKCSRSARFTAKASRP